MSVQRQHTGVAVAQQTTSDQQISLAVVRITWSLFGFFRGIWTSGVSLGISCKYTNELYLELLKSNSLVGGVSQSSLESLANLNQGIWTFIQSWNESVKYLSAFKCSALEPYAPAFEYGVIRYWIIQEKRRSRRIGQGIVWTMIGRGMMQRLVDTVLGIAKE